METTDTNTGFHGTGSIGDAGGTVGKINPADVTMVQRETLDPEPATPARLPLMTAEQHADLKVELAKLPQIIRDHGAAMYQQAKAEFDELLAGAHDRIAELEAKVAAFIASHTSNQGPIR